MHKPHRPPASRQQSSSRVLKSSVALSVAALLLAVLLVTVNAYAPVAGGGSTPAATFPRGTTVQQGQSMVVILSGFTPNSAGSFGFVGRGSGVFVTDSNGSTTISFPVNDPPGSYTFYARQGSIYVTQVITVTGPSSGPASGYPLVVNLPPPTPLVEASQAAGVASLVFGIIAAASGWAYVWRRRPELRRILLVVTLITLAVLAAHLYVIDVPSTSSCTTVFPDGGKAYGCIGDEKYYVPAAQHLLAGDRCYQSLGYYPTDLGSPDYCNLEHTPLAKLMMAEGMAIFGQTAFGWRIPMVLASVLSVPLLFAVVYLLSKQELFSYFAALLLAFDTLFFTQGSGGFLDVPVVFFALAAAVFYLWGKKFWYVDGKVAAGTFMGLSVLSKESGVFLLLGLLTYHFLLHEGGWKQTLVGGVKMLGVAAGVTLAGMLVFYSVFASTAFTGLYGYLVYMLQYAELLRGDSCAGQVPYNWLISIHGGCFDNWIVTNYVPSTGYPVFIYWMVPNMVVVLAVFAWVPYALYRLARSGALRLRSVVGAPKAEAFALVFFSWGYLPYVAFWLLGRTTYPYYMVTASPALAVGAAYFVTRGWFPRWLAVIFMVAAFGWFLVFFPDKGFLPVWLRALIGER